MATIVFGGGITNMVGSAAGNTFARNKGGAYMKKKTHGTNPRSQKQLQHRTVVGRLAKYYTYTLNDADRAAWRTFAATNPVINRVGNTTFLSGQQMFSKLTAPLIGNGGAIVNTPPISAAIASPTLITIVATPDPGGSLTVDIATTSTSANEHAKIWVSPPMNPGRSFISSQLRSLGVIARDMVVDISTLYKNSYGLLPTGPGQRIFVRAAVFNIITGLTSTQIQNSAIWT